MATFPYATYNKQTRAIENNRCSQLSLLLLSYIECRFCRPFILGKCIGFRQTLCCLLIHFFLPPYCAESSVNVNKINIFPW
ncbi:hypothetical protein GDO86_006457 [Hymenochirus boettgeri]|uniref:Uncharacterized protein n=1 Tax=Hymenochirus boettgeri TaxID=247094 RepID=A0A8T2JB63_9PIPI|nr:hypothetical protein GDO86_006457 [Hymenochirus boettgeri]